MNKFFRAYSRPLLMVFMALLVVVWVVNPRPRQRDHTADAGRKIGQAFGEPVLLGDLERAKADAELLQRLGLPVYSNNALDTYLLFEEARRMGVRISRAQAQEMLARAGVGGDRLAEVRDQFSRSLDSIYDTVGQWLAVDIVVRMQMETLHDSLPRMELAYRNETQEALVKLSIIDSEAFLPLVAEPSDEELQKFFEEAKGRRKAHTEEKMLFGYLLPDRFQLEYLTIDPAQLASKIQVREAEVRRFYEEHKNAYIRRPPPNVPPQPGQPTEFKTFEEAEKDAREHARLEKAVREAQALMNEIHRDAARPWEAAAYGPDHYKVPPAPEAQGSFEALRDKYLDRAPVIYHKTDLLDATGLFQRSGLGRAESVEGRQSFGAIQLATRVKGVFTKAAPEDLALNLNEPGPVALDTRPDPATRQPRPYQAYVYRVVQVAPSGPPASWEAAREELKKDVKLLRAHQMAQTYALKLRDRAQEVGLPAAVAENQELKEILAKADPQPATQSTQPAAPGPRVKALGPIAPLGRFTRQATIIPGVGRSARLPKEVFALLETPASAPAPAHRVALVELANLPKWAVAEAESSKTLYAGAFQKELQTFELRRQSQQPEMFARMWLSPEFLHQRTHFTPNQAPQ